MPRRLLPLLLALAALFPTAAAMAAPGDCRLIRGAGTPETSDDVQVCRQDVWFHDTGRKVGNLAGMGQGTLPSWDTTKPTASMSSGAGAVYVANSATEIVMEEFGPESGPRFTGTFTGTLDNLAVDLYARDLRGATNAAANGSVRTRLLIDGELIYTEDTARDVKGSAVGNFRKLSWVYTDVYEAMRQAGLDTSPTAKHDIQLSVLVFFFVTETAFFYDAAEAPSGLVFNQEVLTPYTAFKTTTEE